MSEETMQSQEEMMAEQEKAQNEVWVTLANWQEEGKNIPVTIKGVVNGGVIAYVEGIRGFIPASKLSLSYVENLEDFLMKDMEVRIITVEPENNRLVLSAREILREQKAKEQAEKASQIEVGLVTEGVVETIQPYGAFIGLENGLSGLVHISQICEKRIKSPDVVLKRGDKVQVKVIGLKDGKISLSMKALNEIAEDDTDIGDYDIPKSEELSTNLGSLLKNIKL